MNIESPVIPKLSGLRKPRMLRQHDLIRTARITDCDLPILVEPNIENLGLLSWAGSNRSFIEQLLRCHGGVLFRNFRISGVEEFQRFVTAVSAEPLEYKEQTSPRTKVHGNIYTSTEYPPEQSIFLHNENSYSSIWPLKIMFFCVTEPQTEGETPLADVRRVLARIPSRIRECFEREGWMLVRNFGTGYGLPWQTAFQTNDPEQVKHHCAMAGISVEWLSADRLRIRQRRPAIRNHPLTHEPVWFNHATFFHVSTLDPKIRHTLQSELNAEDLPYNTYYGDGREIEPQVLDVLRDSYQRETVKFAWRKDDLLLLDNMLVAHGRSPFQGPRKIVVGMSEPYSEN